MTLRADCQVRRLDTSKEGESSGKTTETAIDWSVAFQSTEFRSGLADVVAQAVVQVNQLQSGQIAGQPNLGHINALERIGDAIPGTGVKRRLGLEEGASTSTTKVRQGPAGTDICSTRLKAIDRAAQELGISLSPEKCEGPTTHIVFLGIELDSFAMSARLPPDSLGS